MIANHTSYDLMDSIHNAVENVADHIIIQNVSGRTWITCLDMLNRLVSQLVISHAVNSYLFEINE